MHEHSINFLANFHWVCDNPRKIGKEVYGVLMHDFRTIPSLEDPQIMIVVTSPSERKKITAQLHSWEKRPVSDYWFFL
jgi:hypothetical protein